MRVKKPKGILLEHPFSALIDSPVITDWLRGRFSAPPFSLAYHKELEIDYIKRGNGSYYINGKSYPFTSRSLIVIPPSGIHQLIPDFECYLEKASIILKPVGKFARWSQQIPPSIRLSVSDATPMEIIINNIIREHLHKDSYWKEMVQAELLKLFYLVKRSINHPVPARPENIIVTKLINYIESNFAHPIVVSNLVKEFGYSVNYLPKLFKAYTGSGLKQYILQRRVIEAQHLLEKNLKIKAISEQIGFNDFTTFNHAFQKTTGISPDRYRRIAYRHG